MKGFVFFLTFAVLATGLSFCKKNKSGEQEDSFARGPLLENIANNYISPGYAAFQTAVNDLTASWNTFESAPSSTSLEEVKNKVIAADLIFQRIKMLECGPAMNIQFTESLGTFPADTNKIESNITAGSADLTLMTNFDAAGFDALDYLLFRPSSLADLQATNRRTYVSEIIQRMSAQATALNQQWAGYKSTFIAGTGNSSTDPFGLFVNYFCKDYDYAKAAKIAIPLGKTTLGIKKLSYLEMRRSGSGKQMLQANISALRDIFNGTSWSGSTGIGFDDYLIALERSDLATTIDTRLATLTSTPAGWTGNLEFMMVNQQGVVDDYYDYMSATTVYLKTDMTSAFGVVITYQDNDGD